MNMQSLLATFLLGACLSASAQGSTYPERPITAVVTFPPGGSTDMIARAIAPKMGERLGQQVVVENKAGATGAIGATYVKNAAPDGYTIMMASIGVYSVNPHLQKKMGYDPSRDLDMLTIAVRAPNVLIVNPNLPVNSVAELIAYLRKNPGKAGFGTSGAGSSDHLTTALFWQNTGTSGIHTPYKGGAAVLTDLMAGHIEASFQNLKTTSPGPRLLLLPAAGQSDQRRQGADRPQKPMTEIAMLFAEIETRDGQQGLGFSYSKRAGGPASSPTPRRSRRR
jgi:tripartite-type tricarboxylate transporter receptor subunit TctC